jgi:hypothetical protein
LDAKTVADSSQFPMADKPETTARTRTWNGRISNASPHMLPLGAAVDQNNVRCQVEGQLDVRPGLMPITFSNAITAVTDEIIAMYQVPGELTDVVLYETSAGALKMGRTPTV